MSRLRPHACYPITAARGVTHFTNLQKWDLKHPQALGVDRPIPFGEAGYRSILELEDARFLDIIDQAAESLERTADGTATS